MENMKLRWLMEALRKKIEFVSCYFGCLHLTMVFHGTFYSSIGLTVQSLGQVLKSPVQPGKLCTGQAE